MKFQYLFFYILFIAFTAYAQEGLIKTQFANDTLESEINYKNNVREGEAKFYYENGSLKEERFYINGKVEGLRKLYYENGSLKEIANIENGKREGTTSLFDEQGEYLADIDYLQGVKVIPEPVIESPVIVAENTVAETKKEAPLRKENNIKKSESISVPPSLEDTMEDDPAFFATAEVMPLPVGGMNAVYNRLIYPREARSKKIEGTVKVLVYIDEWGDVTQAEVVEGIGFGCDESAKTTIYYTKFSPGLIRGKAVKMRIVVPVEFKLNI